MIPLKYDVANPVGPAVGTVARGRPQGPEGGVAPGTCKAGPCVKAGRVGMPCRPLMTSQPQATSSGLQLGFSFSAKNQYGQGFRFFRVKDWHMQPASAHLCDLDTAVQHPLDALEGAVFGQDVEADAAAPLRMHGEGTPDVSHPPGYCPTAHCGIRPLHPRGF